MDLLAAADNIAEHAQHIFELAKRARTNTRECEAVQSRVEQLLDVLQQLRQHPDVLLSKQICNAEMVTENAKRFVEKYSRMKRGMQRAIRVLEAVHNRHEFENISASLDSVLQGVW